MAIQIVSDVHLEAIKYYGVFEIVPRAPVLALIGDIGNVELHRADLAVFLERQLRQFQAVLYVPGNHEAYHSTWPKTIAILRSLEEDVRKRRVVDAETSSTNETGSGLGELVVLDRGTYRLPSPFASSGGGSSGDTVVLGCSLFSHVPPSSAAAVCIGLNDFCQIGDGWDVNAHNRSHARDLAWLNESVAVLAADETCRSVVVLTHWSPSLDARACDPRFPPGGPLGSAFATDLSSEACFRSPIVRAWAFGHTHYNCDFAVERGDAAPPLRLVTNQRGHYFSQAGGYDDGKTLST